VIGSAPRYSYRGKYYTLAGIPRFDERGPRSCRAVWFARDGNLPASAQRFVEQAPAGITASELQAALHVEVKSTLLPLYQRKRVSAGTWKVCSYTLSGKGDGGGSKAGSDKAVGGTSDRRLRCGSTTIAGPEGGDPSVLQSAG
jgi:hypothetical protein